MPAHSRWRELHLSWTRIAADRCGCRIDFRLTGDLTDQGILHADPWASESARPWLPNRRDVFAWGWKDPAAVALCG